MEGVAVMWKDAGLGLVCWFVAVLLLYLCRLVCSPLSLVLACCHHKLMSKGGARYTWCNDKLIRRTRARIILAGQRTVVLLAQAASAASLPSPLSAVHPFFGILPLHRCLLYWWYLGGAPRPVAYARV